jgi:oxalate decarboxylase/phosphoglucose isomerase-like protein (cupin superfamily)
MAETTPRESTMWSKVFSYDRWMEAQGIPIHKGYYIEDLRTVELGWWNERECNAAFIQLVGLEGVSSTRVVEIPPGKSLPPMKLGLDEIAYALDGRGLTSVWPQEGAPKKTFEWQPHSMFLLPRHQYHQLSNAQGDKPVRLLFYSYLPMAMSAVPEAEFFFNNPLEIAPPHDKEDYYSEAKMIKPADGGDEFLSMRVFWYGNFFPDMRAWDKLDPNVRRGAGGTSVYMQFPHSELSAHMSQFGAGMYKKAHRHGPGRAIIIPKGEGYSIMWEEGKEKVVVPWHECSMVTPPDRWFHQHFNTGREPARYLAIHPPMQFHGHAEKITDRARDQIEYADEEPWIRQKFEEELKKNNVSNLMPEAAYTQRDFDWEKAAKVKG